PLDSADPEEVSGLFGELEARIVGVFDREGIGREEITVARELDLRYVGQEHTLAVVAPSLSDKGAKLQIAEAFDDHHLRVYGHNAPEEPKEIVSLKVIGLGNVTKPNLERILDGGETPPAEARLGTRDVYVGKGQYRSFGIYRRDLLQGENLIRGPAVIEEITATTVVDESQTCRVDPYGNLIIAIDKEGR
ncbi:MAG: hypothetical protein JSW65_00125, partial [Candidatus Bipolaricaulota bacterium]